MKLLILAVVSTTLFRADCRERPSDQEISNVEHSLSGDSGFSNGLDNAYATGDDFYGPDFQEILNNESSTVLPYDHLYSTHENLYIDDMDLGLNPDGSEIQNFTSGYNQEKKDKTVQFEGMLRGGSKTCKPDIVCSLLDGSCIATSTYCSGREVASLCGGEKCKCCIPVSLEVKMHEMETALNTLVVNFTAQDTELHKDMYALAKSIISNITISNGNMIDFANSSNEHLSSSYSELKNELENIAENLTMSNINLINSMNSSNQKLASLNFDIKKEFQQIAENLTRDLMSDVKSELQDMSENLASKIDTIRNKQVLACQVGDGGFIIGNQCFIRYAIKKTWDAALSYCVDKGFNLAQPSDPVLLHQYLAAKGLLGVSIPRHWIGGQGTGSCMAWLNGTCIPKSSPLWETQAYGREGPDSVATNAGLDMYPKYPYHPLDADGKSYAGSYFICEKV